MMPGMDPSMMQPGMMMPGMDPMLMASMDPAMFVPFVLDPIYINPQDLPTFGTMPPPPEIIQAINLTKQALDNNYQPGVTPLGVAQAFSTNVTDVFVGDEHIHATYTQDPDGDGFSPGPHTDASIVIHDAGHTTTIETQLHVPDIQ